MRTQDYYRFKKIKTACIWLYSFLFFIVLFSSCKKDINQNSVSSSGISNAQMATQKIDGSVATDWYHLQLRMISQNPPIPPNVAIRLFSYSGVSLFEAARFAIPNSISLKNQLYQMPAMPCLTLTKNIHGSSQQMLQWQA